MLSYNKLTPVSEVKTMVALGRTMILAGSEELLMQIPKGNWIGGTIPYFMNETGGCLDKKQIFVTDLSDIAVGFTISDYSSASLKNILAHRYYGGFSWVLIPAFSQVHYQYALEVGKYPGLFDIPTVGWITGIDLADLGKRKPKVVNGSTGICFENSAVAIHCALPETQYANPQIINLFQQGDGDVINFTEDGFSASSCLVNGKIANLVKYFAEKNIDTRLPLVADYSGAMINISIQNVDKDKNEVQFYAPVLKNVDYKIAKPIGNYVQEFNKVLPENTGTIAASCNCILNYLYSELEGKHTGSITGPITFGEIAYVLVNQTMVLLSVEDK